MTAGCRVVEIPDAGRSDAIRTFVFYPADWAEDVREFGPYSVAAGWDAPIADGVFPVVAMSHGTGGSPLTHRLLAAHLARNGFVVAAPEHPRNNRNDDSLARTAAILQDRPRQLSAVLDWVFDGPLATAVASGAASVIGHSLGGYTALALAGGKPTAFAIETPDHQPHPVPVVADERVRAAVLLAPAAAWFMSRGALAAVRIPILMLTGDKDYHAPSWHGQIVLDGVADKSLVEHCVIHNAGHFSFLSPFPESMRSPGFEPAQDPSGFDRERFHQEDLYPEVLAFLRRAAERTADASI